MWISGPAPGGAQFDFVENLDGRLSFAASTVTINAVYLSLVRVARPITVVAMYVGIGGTSAGNIDAGIYQFDGTDYVRLGSAGSTPCGTINTAQRLPLTASVTLQPGRDYWLAFGTDSSTATFLRMGSTTTIMVLGNKGLNKTGAWSSGLPATINSPVPAGTTVYLHASPV